jgi:arabinofuranosyltransferase
MGRPGGEHRLSLVRGRTTAAIYRAMKKILSFFGIFLAGSIGPLIFLLLEKGQGNWGFPLDDGWIHQTYARSLAGGQGWTYAGGPPSAGSTSPLWTLLQIPSFWLHLSPIDWSYGLGMFFLILNAGFILLWVRTLNKGTTIFPFILAVGEWHLVWASLSGMETILFCFWVSLMLYLLFPLPKGLPGGSSALATLFPLGILAGIGIWIRPEALLLLAYIFLAVVLQMYPIWKWKVWPFFLGSLLPVLLYFAFNFGFNGRIFPNTFFVKTAEYSVLTAQNLFLRFLQPWIPLLAGPVAALALFFLAAILLLGRNRKAIPLLPFLWALNHILLYAIQLPATYQHGRYFLPVLPVLIGYGVYGYFALKEMVTQRFFARIVVRALWGSALLLTVIFLFIGAGQFSGDVKIIQSNMVEMSQWIRDNTPPDSIVAAHDIGALGFWGNRRIVDLGGVTDLNALPLLSGKIRLRIYLSIRRADFLMTFLDFYPNDLENCIPLHAAEAIPPLSTERMLLFDWGHGCSQYRAPQ